MFKIASTILFVCLISFVCESQTIKRQLKKNFKSSLKLSEINGEFLGVYKIAKLKMPFFVGEIPGEFLEENEEGVTYLIGCKIENLYVSFYYTDKGELNYISYHGKKNNDLTTLLKYLPTPYWN